MTNKLEIAMLSGHEPEFLDLSLMQTIHLADKFVIIQGERNEKIFEIIDKYQDLIGVDKLEVIYSKWNNNDYRMNGRQRNKYLEYLTDDNWCLVLDCDEIISDNCYHLKNYMDKKLNCYDVNMIHFIRDFGHEDSTVPKHYVPRRFFRVTEDLFYNEMEHPVLEGFAGDVGTINDVQIFHCGYLKGMQDVVQKYRGHVAKSNTHSPQFLEQWKQWHVMGTYPTKKYEGAYPYPIRKLLGMSP